MNVRQRLEEIANKVRECADIIGDLNPENIYDVEFKCERDYCSIDGEELDVSDVAKRYSDILYFVDSPYGPFHSQEIERVLSSKTENDLIINYDLYASEMCGWADREIDSCIWCEDHIEDFVKQGEELYHSYFQEYRNGYYYGQNQYCVCKTKPLTTWYYTDDVYEICYYDSHYGWHCAFIRMDEDEVSALIEELEHLDAKDGFYNIVDIVKTYLEDRVL